MSDRDYVIMTNNPLVKKKLGKSREVIYLKVSYAELLKAVRDEIHKGRSLLSHPLAGSMKPCETPYRSVMITAGGDKLDARSEEMIENAIICCDKFAGPVRHYQPDVLRDFQLIDLTLLESGLEAADI